MQKKALLAGLLAASMLLSSCALVKKDAAVDAARTVIEVAGKTITKGEVQNAINNYLVSYQNYFAQQMGYAPDITDSLREMAQGEVIDGLVKNAVTEAKATELGVGELTEEEQAAVDSEYENYANMIRQLVLNDSGLEGEELENQVAAYVYSYFGVTKESMRAQKINDKLREAVVKDVAEPTESEIQAEFDSRVASAKSTYASNLSAYGTAVNNGETVYYRPAGYRMVKQILVQYDQAHQDEISNLNTKITDANTQISNLTGALNGVENVDELLEKVTVKLTAPVEEPAEPVATPTDVAEAEESKPFEYLTEVEDTLAEDLDASTRENLRALKTAKELKTAYEAKLEEATEAAYASIDAEADEVLTKLNDGADWDALMAETTDDPGMQGDRDTAKNGYAICEGFSSFDTAFTTAAMALEKVGDVTGKVRGSSNGYYIIRYVADVAEGAVDLADVAEGIKSDVLTDKQNSYFDAQIAKWIEDAKAKIDLKVLND